MQHPKAVVLAAMLVALSSPILAYDQAPVPSPIKDDFVDYNNGDPIPVGLIGSWGADASSCLDKHLSFQLEANRQNLGRFTETVDRKTHKAGRFWVGGYGYVISQVLFPPGNEEGRDTSKFGLQGDILDLAGTKLVRCKG